MRTTSDPQAMVREFMVKMRQHMADSPTQPPPDVVMLRYRLILSEALEAAEAMFDHDMPALIDALCDLLYVTYGCADAFGVTDLAPYFAEVHRTNMLKDPDCKDEHGKVIKPPGWEPPHIAGMLAELTERPPEWACACVRRIRGSWTDPQEETDCVVHWGDNKWGADSRCKYCNGDGGIGRHRELQTFVEVAWHATESAELVELARKGLDPATKEDSK